MRLRPALMALAVSCSLLRLTIPPAVAQDALRYSLAGEAAARARTQSLQDQDYNLRIGNATLRASASMGLELNDNIRLTDTNSKEDVILSPLLSTAIHWPVTQKNSLNFTLGLGYTKYISQSQYDYLVISPGSELSFDVFVKDFRFTFFDRFSYTQDPLQNGAVSGVARYGGIDNSAGVNAIWDLNKALLSAGYAHQNFILDQSEFDYLTRASELFTARAGFLLTPTILAGPEASSSLINYDKSYLHNAVSYSGGAYGQIKVTPFIQLEAHGGFVGYDFSSGGVTQVTENPRTYYFDLRANHILNERISHQLSGGRNVTVGTYADFQEQYYARYSILLNVIRHVGLGLQLFFEHGTYPAISGLTGTTSTVYYQGEAYDRYGVLLSTSYRVMEKLDATLAYRFTLKNSEVNARDYSQNALTLGLTYRF